MMSRSVKNVVVLAMAFVMLVAAKEVWADDPEDPVVCCTDGAQCNPGEACCKKKSPATACSETVPKQCVTSASECALEDE